MNTKTTKLLLFVAVVSGIIIPSTAYAQTDVISTIDAESGIKVIGVGVLAGIVVAYQGYRATNKNWDTLKFFDGILQSILGAVPFAIGYAVTQTNMGIFEYVAAFFAAIGTGYMIKQTRKKTIPSNQTSEATIPEQVNIDDEDTNNDEELPPGKITT